MSWLAREARQPAHKPTPRAGFGRSPYSHSFPAIALNLWFIGCRLLGLELARWYLVVTLARRSTLVGFAISWFLLVLAAVPLAGFIELGGVEATLSVSGRSLFPGAAEGLLATYLALIGGPVPAIAYRGLVELFEWASPVLPNLAWTFSAFIGTVAPVLGLVLAHDLLGRHAAESEAQTDEQVDKGSSWGIGWVLIAVAVVFVFWFNAGFFGVWPALISGISMEPSMGMGDIAVTRPVAPSEVKVGDIVRYSSQSGSILHHVYRDTARGPGCQLRHQR